MATLENDKYPTTGGGEYVEHGSDSDSFDRDAADMAKMGKTQVLKRNFGLIPLLGFTTIMLCTWESVFPFFYTGFINGGGISLIYGYCFCFLGSLATCASISEMASMYPTSGGQYHWVALLAPEKYSKFLSWVCGWVSVLGWQAGAASGTFLGGTIIQGLIILNYPDYTPYPWQATCILYAVVLICVFVNTVFVRLLPALEGLILFFHVIGFFAILIPLVHLAPISPADFVFATFINDSSYPDGLSWFVGLTASSVLFIGYDGAAHMSEEVKNAAINVPRSMFFTIFLNGSLGLAMFIVLLFCIGNVDDALSTPTGYPFIEIFYNATGSVAGTTAMTSLLIGLIIFATFGYVASASRQMWAFARDRGLPASSILSKVHFAIPIYAVGLTAFFSAALGSINLGSTVAFNAIISLLAAGLFSSYMLSIGLMIRKKILKEPLPFGPWNMGSYGIYVNYFAFFYTFIVFVFSFFPPALPVTPESMNWSIVVFGGVILTGAIYWLTAGRNQYTGPVIDRVFTEGGLQAELGKNNYKAN